MEESNCTVEAADEEGISKAKVSLEEPMKNFDIVALHKDKA